MHASIYIMHYGGLAEVITTELASLAMVSDSNVQDLAI